MTSKIYIDKFGIVKWKDSDRVVDSPNITYIDNNGYLRYRDNNRLVHRDIAYRYIYSADRKRYPLQFRDYQVHHKDNEKQNNRYDNLQLVTKLEHEDIQGYEFQSESTKRPFYEDPEPEHSQVNKTTYYIHIWIYIVVIFIIIVNIFVWVFNSMK